MGQTAPLLPGTGDFLRQAAHKILTGLARRVPDTAFSVRFWDDTTEHYGRNAPLFSIHVKTIAAVRRVLRDGGFGFAEAHMDGEIDIEGDLRELFKLQYIPDVFDIRGLSLWEKLRAVWVALRDRNTLEQVKKNVAHHYDLSYDFYRLWLDKSMTYTCAYFANPGDTLEQAQLNKHEHICRKLRLEPGMSLVDIGCGWGAMLLYAAEKYGVHAVGYTISKEQYTYLTAEIERRGMQGRVEVRLQDYREAEGQFDRWVSIGMFEQVGSEYVGTFMDKIGQILKPGGIGLLHTIGYRYRNMKSPWITRYIFPGGFLPSLGEMTEPMGEKNLNVYDVEDLRLHYGETLDNWDRRFCQNIDTIRAMYGERFVRMWRLYLNGSASAFRYGGARLYQVAFTNGIHNQGYRTRMFLYDRDTPVPAFNVPSIDLT